MNEEMTNEQSENLEEQEGLNSQIENEEAAQSENQNEDKPNENENQEAEKEDVNDFVGKPENYTTNDIKLPEGMTLNQDVLKEFNEFADKTNLSQKGYNEAVNYGIKLVEKTKNDMLELFQKAEEQKITGYQRACFNDPEIGGENYQKALSEAVPAYKQFANEETQKLFAETGLQYHPAIIKMFRNISAQMVDDSFHTGAKTNKDETSREERMFPEMFKK